MLRNKNQLIQISSAHPKPSAPTRKPLNPKPLIPKPYPRHEACTFLQLALSQLMLCRLPNYMPRPVICNTVRRATIKPNTETTVSLNQYKIYS